MVLLLHDDRGSLPVGAVVAYERIEHDNGAAWSWALGTIQRRMDDHSCVVRRWDREAWGDDFLSSSTSGSSQPVINVLTNELNRVNIRLKDTQRRLFDVERSIISQRSPESSTNNEGNTSINEYNKIRSNAWVQSGVSPTGEMATCIHEMNHCRARSKSLSDELNRLKKSPTVAPSVMCFTRHRGEEETILASSLIRVLPVDVDDPTCVITEAEAASIETEAGALRVELQQQLGRANDHLQSLMTELHCLQTYNEELEARTTLCQDAFLQMANLGASKETPRMPSASTFENIEQLRDEVGGTVQWDWQQNEPQRRGKAVTTRHTVDFPWSGADILVENKPEELMATFSMEVARGLGAPPHCVSNVTFHASPMGLTAKFDVHHPVNLPGSQVDALLRDYGFPYLQHLHLGADGPKKGLDFAIEEVCRVLGIQEGKYNGLRFDEFVEQLQEINMSTDKDAYESEVGDMLILMDKLHNENRSLHHALAKSNAEIRKQTAETQREREELKKRTSELYREIKRLNDVLAKLRELADSQEEELQQYKLEKAHIQHVRTQRHLDKEEYHDKDIYCITLQEYIKEQGRVARLQQEIQEEERKNQERLCTLQEQNQQLKTLMEEKTKEMDELQLELRVFRQKRRDSQAVRVQDGLLTTDASPKIASEQNSETVHPHVLANEPLFSVTLEELNEIRNTNVKLAEEMVQKAGIIRELEEILTQKETKTVKLETTLTQREADNEKLAEELAQREAVIEGAEEDACKTIEGVYSRCRELEELAARRELAATGDLDILERELADALVQLKALEGENAALAALLAAKKAEMVEASDAAGKSVRELESRLSAAVSEASHERAMAEKLLSTTRGALTAMVEENQKQVEQLRADHDQARATMQAELVAHREMRNARINERLSHPELCDSASPQMPPPNTEVPVAPEIVRSEPLYSVTLDELNKTTTLNEQLTRALAQREADNEKLAEELAQREADNEKLAEELAQREADNEKLTEELAQREADNEKLAEEIAQREADNEKLTEDLAQREADNKKLAEELAQREADNEKLAEDLVQREADCHKLVAELDVIESKLNSAMSDLHVFSSGDGGVIEMLEGYMERASLVSGAEKEALERLSLSDKEIAMLRSDFLAKRDGMSREIELEKAEKARLLGELELTKGNLETLKNASVVASGENELSVLRQKICDLEEVVDVKNAHLESLNERLEGLVEELHDKREELFHVIGQLDDFVVKFEKAREGEKVAVEKLAARDQELFELERMHRELQTEHEQIVSHLQKQVEELRAQQSDDAIALEDLKGDIKGLRLSLQEAQGALREKNDEINRLKEEIIAQQEEAQALIDELAEERDQKSLEVSDSLKKLEEFVELMEGARKCEEEALQRSADAERSLCRAQEELERLRTRQVEGRDNPKASELDTLRAALDEACDVKEHAEEENKKLKLCVRLLTDALSKNQGRFTASSGVLEEACDALSNMQEG